MKHEGDFNGVPIYSDPGVPDGIVYFLDEEYMHASYMLDTRSRFKKAVAWIKNKLHLT